MIFKKNLFLTTLWTLPVLLLTAQEIPFPEETTKTPVYFFELQEDGTPLFKQRLSWNEISGALAYEIIIQNEEHSEIFRERQETAHSEFSLHPGQYRYRINVYNLLDKVETQTDWIPLSIIKAELPHIALLAPEKIYIEEGHFQLELTGENLSQATEYWLIEKETGNKLEKLTDFTIDKHGRVIINLPEERQNPGTYSVWVINPGGLSHQAPGDVTISYLKPFDISLSVGYSPLFILYDDWFTGYWDSLIYPAGATVRADFIFLKRRSGYLGLELLGTTLNFNTDVEGISILSYYYSGGVNLLYKYPFSSKLHLALRAGGGAVVSNFTFDYNGIEGTSIESGDPYGTAGLSLQYYFTRALYTEVGVDFRHIFYEDYSWGGILPFLSAGLAY
ncbi:MAG: hypothetical protein PQJ59_00555 [Spirochaetales bacterium]|nr:hypothetical protein [Spirochaetales bacterium]